MTADSTWATVVSANDYYAFGSSMVGRNFNDNTYRYGFNGKEKDEKGELGDTHYDYGFRIYNPRLGRFLSVDPLTKSYPWYTPYQFAGNNPIWAIDIDGLEEYIKTYQFEDGKATLLRIVKNSDFEIREKMVGERNGQVPFETIIIDKRTGKPMNPKEIGQMQYKYVDSKGNQLKIRRDYDGRYVEGENEMMSLGDDNYFGSIYIGSNNQTYEGADGEDYADYRREPQEGVDEDAMYHDMDYDGKKAGGITDALFNKGVRPADEKLVKASTDIIKSARAGGNDPKTNRPITTNFWTGTVFRANMVKSFFNLIIKSTVFKADIKKIPNDERSEYYKFGE